MRTKTAGDVEAVLRQLYSHDAPSYVELNVHPMPGGGVDVVAVDASLPGPDMPVARVHLPQGDVSRIAHGPSPVALRLFDDVRRWLLRDLRAAQELALGIRGEV